MEQSTYSSIVDEYWRNEPR